MTVNGTQPQSVLLTRRYLMIGTSLRRDLSGTLCKCSNRLKTTMRREERHIGKQNKAPTIFTYQGLLPSLLRYSSNAKTVHARSS